MKLRIKGNTLRLRVSQSELRLFAARNKVEDRIQFGPGKDQLLSYTLEQSTSRKTLGVRFTGNHLIVMVPRQIAVDWVETEKVGLDGSILLGNGQSLEVLVEKDFQCLHRDGEETDNYPNPRLDRD